MDVDAVLAGLYELVAPYLTEQPRRLLAGAAVRAWAAGGGARMPASLGCPDRRWTPGAGAGGLA